MLSSNQGHKMEPFKSPVFCHEFHLYFPLEHPERISTSSGLERQSAGVESNLALLQMLRMSHFPIQVAH